MSILNSLGLSLFEIRCPECKSISQMKLTGLEPRLSQCPPCKTLLVLQPSVKQKPNNVLLSVEITAVEKANPQEQGLKVSRIDDVREVA